MIIPRAFVTLVEREAYRFLRLARQTVVPSMITTIMYILIFGHALGSRIKDINGTEYIAYILPGLVQMGVITNAYANSSTSLFMARLERSIENILVAPIPHFEIVSAYMLGGILRGLVVGLTVMGSARLFLPFTIANWGDVVLGLVMTSALFSGLGIISGLLAESWDKIATYTNFVITPFIYLGGVFYSIHMLPDFFRQVSLFNPIFYCVDLVRHGFLGHSDSPAWIARLSLTVAAVAVYLVCVRLFQVGYKLMK